MISFGLLSFNQLIGVVSSRTYKLGSSTGLYEVFGRSLSLIFCYLCFRTMNVYGSIIFYVGTTLVIVSANHELQCSLLRFRQLCLFALAGRLEKVFVELGLEGCLLVIEEGWH